MKVEDRDLLRAAAARHRARLTLVFTAGVMERNQRPQGVLNLSTTERETPLKSTRPRRAIGRPRPSRRAALRDRPSALSHRAALPRADIGGQRWDRASQE